MAASRAVFSFPTMETKLLNRLAKISLPISLRREICTKCRIQQSHSVDNLFLQPTQISNKTSSNLRSDVRVEKCVAEEFPAKNVVDQHLRYPETKGTLSSPDFNRRIFPSSSLSLHQLSFTSQRRQLRRFHVSAGLSSSSQSDISSNTSPDLDPFKLMETEMSEVMTDVRKVLRSSEPLLQHMSQYYFNGKGKTFRPLVALLMARACNIHVTEDPSILWQQKIVAMVSEMIHTASLVHDDVIDASDTRRSQASLNMLYGQRQAILTGDYILSQASIAVARTNHPEVIRILASILVDLVNGEFMQLGSKENESERFSHYFGKTYKKTASLIANCCKSVAILGQCETEMVEASFQYGRNLGLAFQLIDDLLDFTSCDTDLGKPTAADLKQGLATAPVLFAASEFPELQAMIMRRFSHDGDVEYARHAVDKSDGVEQTRILASQHSKEAIRQAMTLTNSEARGCLIRLAQILLERKN